jgi:hypothetical protein
VPSSIAGKQLPGRRQCEPIGCRNSIVLHPRARVRNSSVSRGVGVAESECRTGMEVDAALHWAMVLRWVQCGWGPQFIVNRHGETRPELGVKMSWTGVWLDTIVVSTSQELNLIRMLQLVWGTYSAQRAYRTTRRGGGGNLLCKCGLLVSCWPT